MKFAEVRNILGVFQATTLSMLVAFCFSLAVPNRA